MISSKVNKAKLMTLMGNIIRNTKPTTKVADLGASMARPIHRGSVCPQPAVNRQPGSRWCLGGLLSMVFLHCVPSRGLLQAGVQMGRAFSSVNLAGTLGQVGHAPKFVSPSSLVSPSALVSPKRAAGAGVEVGMLRGRGDSFN